MPDFPPDAAILLLAVALDSAGRELPARLHPTVWMGRTIAGLERLAPRRGAGRQLAYGGLMALLIPAAWAAAGLAVWGLRWLDGFHPWASPLVYVIGGAVLLKTTFALGMLRRTAAQIRALLAADDLAGVRVRMRSLVSRDTAAMTAGQAIAATVESVAENSSDSFIGPWLAFAVFGLPGAFAYRAVNTLDSMIGYRGEYEYLGKAAARLDDLVNLIPARLTAILLLLGSIVLPGQRFGIAWRVMARDHSRTASPNAGWPMSVMAGALGVQLSKAGHYTLGSDDRPLEIRDITRALQGMYAAAVPGLLLALAVIFLRYGMGP